MLLKDQPSSHWRHLEVTAVCFTSGWGLGCTGAPAAVGCLHDLPAQEDLVPLEAVWKNINEAEIIFYRSSCAHRRCLCSDEPNGEHLHPKKMLLFWKHLWQRFSPVRSNLQCKVRLCLCNRLFKHISWLPVKLCSFLPHWAQNWLKKQRWVGVLLH